ncbi:invasion associated locus B family protein [Aurantiacibacter gangjinensis]|uniref:Uncharacterized protein n=1 Tax=Aurantiacibacter gangjinensis TaxID=502682 RepID=A0A0G9MTM9_9SPHN|nr:invasion associated locus B family protein [Aurantiacibacter gangjinensis]APE28391.1 hypothetical protein BMF35_a1562 [Aurantiacibacter gangjinensis]KLE32618.1 hypothetical protein AAW01_00685 [Aurantiacibacter gangjinensis]
MHAFSLLAATAILATAAAPTNIRDSLGVFGDWGAFRDSQVPRCYAIAAAQPSQSRRDHQPFATVGTWPDRQVRGQVHFNLSRNLSSNPRLRLAIGGQRFDLTGGGNDAWATGPQDDAAIVAAFRAGSRMSISATDNRGNRFTDRYSLQGAATAMDAASVGCARQR